jgi:SAM-dependent methyltransferase
VISMDPSTANRQGDDMYPTADGEKKSAPITFSFGANWKSYVESMPEDALDGTIKDLTLWLSPEQIAGKTVLDIGSGSGLHSLAFLHLGASRVRSFDRDPDSVDATRMLWRKAGSPTNWDISRGSILDPNLVGALGSFDIVYCWGVLHHTGSLWEAMGNTTALVGAAGRLWVAIYVRGPHYAKHLATKQRYNAASRVNKRLMEVAALSRAVLSNVRRTANPLEWLPHKERGMSQLHDARDWLGGLPYEVASADEVVTFCRRHGLVLDRIATAPEGSCHRYLFSRPGTG